MLAFDNIPAGIGKDKIIPDTQGNVFELDNGPTPSAPFFMSLIYSFDDFSPIYPNRQFGCFLTCCLKFC